MFDPDAHMPRINRGMVNLGACLIAGIRLARESQVHVRVVPTSRAIEESVELAHEISIVFSGEYPQKSSEDRTSRSLRQSGSSNVDHYRSRNRKTCRH
jgi:hypothetical protein